MRTMMRKLMLLSLALALAAPALPALAGRPVDQTLDADSNGTVNIEIGAGRLTIRGWDRDQVRVQGTVPDDEDLFEIGRSGRTVSIEVALPECDGNDCDWDMDWDSDESHHSEGTDEHGERKIKQETRTRVKIDGKHRIRAEDTDLEIDVPFGSSLDIEAISSEISITDLRGEVSIESVSGNVEIDAELQELGLEVVSGEIRVTNRGPLREADIEAVSGGVELRTGLADNADISIETVNGGIEIWLPANASCEVTAETFSGDIDNDFGQKAVKESSMLPSKSLEFTLGNGEGEVSLQTFNGTIRIRKN